MSAAERKRSKYAAKQGRARRDSSVGGRTRYAPTSPFSDAYRANPNHRLALYWQRGEDEYRELAKRRKLFEQRYA